MSSEIEAPLPLACAREAPSEDGAFRLYCTGDDYFPAVFRAIEAAREEVLFEVYIYADDQIGRRVAEALAAAARRGLRVMLIVDGWGARPIPRELFDLIGRAGGEVYVFRPVGRFFPLTKSIVLKRTHRKLVVVDSRVAFVGGINVIDEQLARSTAGTRALFDYAIGFAGGLAHPLRNAILDLSERSKLVAPAGARRKRAWWRRSEGAVAHGAGSAWLVLRGQVPGTRHTIEREYQRLIEGARQEILIANAYFLPRRKMVRALIQAAQRGVRVRLLLQDKTDIFLLRWATRGLYARFERAGVEVYEDSHAVMHAKVAVFDRETLTVGSSNLDPVSLESNLEANVFVKDSRLAEALTARLEQEIRESCREAKSLSQIGGSWLRRIFARFCLIVVRSITVRVLPGPGREF